MVGYSTSTYSTSITLTLEILASNRFLWIECTSVTFMCNVSCKEFTLHTLSMENKRINKRDLSITAATHTHTGYIVCVCDGAEIPLLPTPLKNEGTLTLPPIFTHTYLMSDVNVYVSKGSAQ